MKVIGLAHDRSMSRGEMIVIASEAELLKISGRIVHSGNKKQFNIGEEINVARMYEQIRVMAEHQKEISGLSAKLRRIADELDNTHSVVQYYGPD